MRRNCAGDVHVVARSRSRDHQRARLDLIRHHGIIRAVQLAAAANANHIRARTLDVRAHAGEEIGQVHDMRLLGRVMYGRHARRGYRRKHGIDRRAHGGHIQEYV